MAAGSNSTHLASFTTLHTVFDSVKPHNNYYSDILMLIIVKTFRNTNQQLLTLFFAFIFLAAHFSVLVVVIETHVIVAT